MQNSGGLSVYSKRIRLFAKIGLLRAQEADSGIEICLIFYENQTNCSTGECGTGGSGRSPVRCAPWDGNGFEKNVLVNTSCQYFTRTLQLLQFKPISGSFSEVIVWKVHWNVFIMKRCDKETAIIGAPLFSDHRDFLPIMHRGRHIRPPATPASVCKLCLKACTRLPMLAVMRFSTKRSISWRNAVWGEGFSIKWPISWRKLKPASGRVLAWGLVGVGGDLAVEDDYRFCDGLIR